MGVIGIVHGAQGGGVITGTIPSGFRLAVLSAANWLLESSASKMLLITDEWNGPVEADPVIADAIRLCIGRNITVIIPAGNGGRDLDTYVDGMGRRVFNPTSPDYVNTGAIVVGAATSTVPHRRVTSPDYRASNYGSRVDCYAWGENITTCAGSPDDPVGSYTTNFGGTSGAAAIVAGAAASLLGMAHERGIVLSPAEICDILRDQNINTPSADPATDRIGVIPNLRRMFNERLLNHDPSFIADQIFIYPEFVQILGGIEYDGGGIIIGPGGVPIPVGPWDGFARLLTPAKKNMLIGRPLQS